MRLPSLFPSKKLRATTARRSLGVPDEMDYEEMSEPNMKLSRALLIVLVLHVVAVAGIIAFNTIKTRQGPAVSEGSAKTKSVQQVEATKADGASDLSVTQRDESTSARAATKSVAKEERKPERTKSAESGARTYVVAKGDNPVTIARKLKISYDDLIAANHIDDPHKLQIGQKLIIPAKSTKPKKIQQ
jgi:LysM repeat protein